MNTLDEKLRHYAEMVAKDTRDRKDGPLLILPMLRAAAALALREAAEHFMPTGHVAPEPPPATRTGVATWLRLAAHEIEAGKA